MLIQQQKKRWACPHSPTEGCAERVFLPQLAGELRSRDTIQFRRCFGDKKHADTNRSRTTANSASAIECPWTALYIRGLPCPKKLRRARNQCKTSRGLHLRRVLRNPAPMLFSTRQAVDSDRPGISSPRRLSQCRCPASASENRRLQPMGKSLCG